MLQNYGLIKKNNIYEQIYDMLDEENISMHKVEHNDKIIYHLTKLLNDSNIICVSENYNSKNDILESMMLDITNTNKNENLQGNTLLSFANDSFMYEIFYLEDLIQKQDEKNLNNFASMSNINMEPIYHDCAIFKTKYTRDKLEENKLEENKLEENKLVGDIITKEEIINIMIENFYHNGILIDTDDKLNELTDIKFTGENPFNFIGNNFTQSNITDILGFNILPYIENESNNTNTLATFFLGREIKGRVFISLLCPISNKKIWSIYKTTIKNIIQILNNKELVDKIYEETDNNYINSNPFYILSKYCQ